MVERASRLQGLLSLRHLQRKQAKGNLATISADLNQVDRKLKAARSQLGNMTTTSGSNLAMAAAIRDAARMRIQEGIAHKEYTEAVMEQHQQEWKGVRRLATTLERLEDRHNEAVLADDLHKEQIILDGTVS